MNNSNYIIDNCNIIDNRNNKEPKTYYIRDVADFGSHEFDRSNLSYIEKLSMIKELGKPLIVDTLKKCFEKIGKPYNAEETVTSAINTLTCMAKSNNDGWTDFVKKYKLEELDNMLNSNIKNM